MIEDRLAAAGLPPLPRTAWLEMDLDGIGANLVVPARAGGRLRSGPPRGEGRCLRSRRDPGRAARSSGPARTGCASPRSTRPLPCVKAPSAVRSIVLYPIPAGGVGDAAVNGLSLTVGDRASEEHLLAAIASLPRGTPDLAVHIEVETGLGRGGIGLVELAAGTGPTEPGARGPSDGALDAPPGARGRPADGGPAGPVRRGGRDRARGRFGPPASCCRERRHPVPERPGL